MHPVNGMANLTSLSPNPQQKFRINADSKNSNVLQVPISTCEEKWKISLGWEYDGQNYEHHREFEVTREIQVDA